MSSDVGVVLTKRDSTRVMAICSVVKQLPSCGVIIYLNLKAFTITFIDPELFLSYWQTCEVTVDLQECLPRKNHSYAR